jgi:hypothetical protein
VADLSAALMTLGFCCKFSFLNKQRDYQRP